MTYTWYTSDLDQAYLDQAYCPSYAKIRHTVVRHIQVHLYFIILQVSVNRYQVVKVAKLVYIYLTRWIEEYGH